MVMSFRKAELRPPTLRQQTDLFVIVHHTSTTIDRRAYGLRYQYNLFDLFFNNQHQAG
jgi:hypothetical protein